jgi:TolA-binding protein
MRKGRAMKRMRKVQGFLGALTILIVSLTFTAGCNLSSDQALQEQKRENEELQKKLDEQQRAEERRKEKEEEARQKELEQQVDDLQKKVDDQEQQTSDSSDSSSDGDIQNLSTSPSQATEGIVVVSPDFNAGAATAEEAAAINAAIDYYQYAEIGDYYTTYDLLSYEDQSYYTQDEWVTANTALDSAAGEFVVTDAYPDDLGLAVPTYAVTVTVYTDDSSFNRTTYFIYEDGHWAHYLSGEEVDMFDGALY